MLKLYVELYELHVILGFNDDDVFWQQHAANISRYEPHFLHVNYVFMPLPVVIRDGKTVTSVINITNTLVQYAYTKGAEYIVRVNDDTQFVSKGWLTQAVKTLKSYNPPNIGVVGPMCHQGNTGILTHDMIHRTHMKIFETYWPTYFVNWYGDTWITDVYKRVHRITILQTWEVKHNLNRHGTRYNPFSPRQNVYNQLVDTGVNRIKQYLDNRDTSACAATCTMKPLPQKVIAYSLYGTNARYTDVVSRVVQNAKRVYPGWSVRIFVPADFNTVSLKNLNIDLCTVRGSKCPSPMWYRMYFLNDFPAEFTLVRDIDSLLTMRESRAVHKWMESGLDMHVMRDAKSGHDNAINGGMFGVRKTANVNWRLILDTYVDKREYGADLNVLANAIFDRAVPKAHILQHDSHTCVKWGAQPFPDNDLDDGVHYVGEAVREDGRNHYFPDASLKTVWEPPAECSPTPLQKPKQFSTASLKKDKERAKVNLGSCHKIVVGIFSTADNGDGEHIRREWMQMYIIGTPLMCGVNFVFVHGKKVNMSFENKNDTVILNIAENLNNGKSFQWFKEASVIFKDASYIFKMDMDTSVCLSDLETLLLKAANAKADYVGHIMRFDACGEYPHCPQPNDLWHYMSGSFYGLSRAATLRLSLYNGSTSGYEDLMIGKAIHSVMPTVKSYNVECLRAEKITNCPLYHWQFNKTVGLRSHCPQLHTPVKTTSNHNAEEQPGDWEKYLPAHDSTPDRCVADGAGAEFLRAAYEKKFESLKVECPSVERFGGAGDGGKLLCADLIKKNDCIVYSFGSRLDFSFETAIVRSFGCRVFTFDCTVGGTPGTVPPGVTFKPWCVGVKDEQRHVSSDIVQSGKVAGQFYTLGSIIRKLQHARIDVLKVDIERHEFELISSLAAVDIMPRQIAIELHLHNAYGMWGRPVSEIEWEQAWNILNQTGFSTYSHEPNPNCLCCCEYSLVHSSAPADQLRPYSAVHNRTSKQPDGKITVAPSAGQDGVLSSSTVLASPPFSSKQTTASCVLGSKVEQQEFVAAGRDSIRKLYSPEKWLRKGAVIIEFGSFTGVDLSVFGKRAPHQSYEVHTYEPSKRAFAQLKSVLKVFPNMHVHNYGVAMDDAPACLQGEGDAVKLSFDIIGCKNLVQMVSLSKTLAEFKLIDVIQINCEGCEVNIVKALHASAAKNVRWVEMQVHPQHVSAAAYCEIDAAMRDLGFKLSYRFEYTWELWEMLF